jgi:hypothetical protein
MDLLGTAARWLAVLGVLAALGILVLLGIGQRRGTWSYRVRIGLWVALISLGGGTVLASTFAPSDDPPRKSEGQQPAAPEDGTALPRTGVYYSCYDPTIIEGVLEPDVTPQPSGSEPDVTSPPEEKKPDVVVQPQSPPRDPIEMCYYVM